MKCRKLLSAVLVLCMMLTSFAAYVSADEAVSYDASVITFSYGEDAASALVGGKTLTAKVSVSKTGGEQNMTFAMFLYKNNKPIDADISTKPVSGEKVDFDVSIGTPADVTGCHVVAFLWDSLKGMNAVCNSAIFPGASTKVSAITVDGTPLNGFNPDVYNYTYEVEATRKDAPVITAKAFDGSAKITIVNPTDFPGKSVVEVVLPDGSKAEYNISYVAKGNTEFLKDLTTCYDNKLPEEVGGNITHLAEYAPKSFEVGQLGYLNRNYTIATINDNRLMGKDRIIQSYSLTSTNNGGADKDVSVFQSKETHPWINFTLLRGATVRVLLCDNAQKAKLTALGYKEEVSTNANGFFNVMVGTANKAHKYMYSKHYDAGARVSIPNVGEGNNSVYTVVVDYDPFGYVPGEDEEPEDPTPDTPVVPDEPKDESLDIKAISVGGVAVDGFSADTLEYTVNLTSDMAMAKEAPAVSYELADNTSSAVVTNPSEFPGKATVTVTNAENKTRTYVLNYSVENVLDITTNVADKNLMYIPHGLDIGGRVAADRDPKATWYISEINYEAFKKNDLIVGGVNSTEGVNEFTFNLPRKAIVTVVYNTAGAAAIVNANGAILKEKGFTYENDTSYYKIVVSNRTNTTQRWYRMMYYKNMEAGEYTLPYCVPEMPALVTFKYIPWGADDFDTEEPDTPDVPDVPVVPEVNDLALKSISVDGVKVANFDADTKEYTVNLTNAQAGALDAPVVTFELEDTNSSAVVTNPTEFPGKATVTVTNTKNETNTYTVNYALTEELLAITTNAAGQKMMYKPGGFKLGGWLASDRNADEGSWSMTTINVPELIGNDSIFGGVNATADVTRVTFNLPRAATVRTLVNTIGNADIHARINGELLAEGFIMDADLSTDKVVASLNNVTRIYQKMFAKNMEAGEITIPYGVPDMPMMIALDYLPWGDNTFIEPVDPKAGIKLKSLKIDGVEVSGFDADTTEYTVALTDSQLASLAVPRVTYKLMADSSEATVVNPETFPGKATVTVSDGEGGERTYTVTYTADEMIKDMYVLNENNTISKEYTGGANDVVLSGNNLPKYVRSGLVEYTDKQPIYTDRNGLRGIHDTTLVGNDVILTPVNWSQAADIKAAFGGTKVLDWLNFTVKRDAVVKVFTDSRNPNNSNITDYGYVKNTNGVMNVACCNTARAYFCNKINGTLDRCQTIMYTKSFKAGEKVVIPNFTFNDYSYSVAIEYPEWDLSQTKYMEVSLDGEAFIDFDASVTEYDVYISYGEAYPVFGAMAQVEGLEIDVVQPSEANGGKGTITVTEDGTETTYIFNVTVLDSVISSGEITKVADGRDAIVSIVHDDGIYNTATYLNQKLGGLGLKGSVAVVAQNINESNRAQWQAIWDDGNLNLESHSYTHTYMGQSDEAETALVNGSIYEVPAGKMTKEIVGSQEYLREMFPGQRVLNFIKPGVGTIKTADGSASLPQISKEAMELIKENYISARSTGNTAYTKQGVDTIPPKDYYTTYCWMVQNNETGEEWISAVEEAVAEKAWSSFLFHGISENAPTNNEAKTQEVDKLLEKIAELEKAGKVWVPFYADAIMYTKESISAKAIIMDYTTNPDEDDIIEIIVTDELDNDIYNYPLTVKTKVPAYWAKADFIQGERTEVLTSFVEDGETYVYAHVVPDSGVATLSYKEPEVVVIPKATLSDIMVDGVSIEDFEAETFTYEVEFDVAALTMPSVTYTVNGEGTAIVTEPTSFPGEVKITVTEDDHENVYTLKYVPSMEYITDLKLCDEANVASTHAVFPKVVSGIKAGDKHFTDRGYAIETINEEGIENSDRIMTSTGWRWDETHNYSKVFNGNLKDDWMSFTLNRGAYVTVYDDSTVDNNMFIGFETESSSAPYIYVKYNETRGASYTVKHTRYFTAGSNVNIPNASTGETYAVVITYAPWNFTEPEVEEIPEFRISYSDLVPKVISGENANVTVGNWYNYVSESVMNKKFSKEFAMPEGSDTQTITLTLDKFTNQNVAIIVNPTEEGASKDVIVNSDGSAIEWSNHDQASVDYDYDGAGEDGYNADYVTYAQYAKNVTTLSSGDSYVYRTMVSSDDKYITGSMVVYSRNLLCGGVAWIDIPEEYTGCNYIVPHDGKINGGTYTLTFTVNAPVEVAIYTNGTAATVSDDISEDAWLTESASFKKRHMNVVDNLTIAYMIKKGYLPMADIGAYATANNTNGYRIRRFDLFGQLQSECGVGNGWAIDPAKKEATGFTGTINDYTYDQYLAAWVDEE